MHLDKLGSITKVQHVFKEGPQLSNSLSKTKSNKHPVLVNGVSEIAEIAVLDMYRKQGYEGVWVDNFPKTSFWKNQKTHLKLNELPEKEAAIIGDIKTLNNGMGGCWDLILWKDDEIKFVELKAFDDKIQDSQIQFKKNLESISKYRDRFILFEWKYETT